MKRLKYRHVGNPTMLKLIFATSAILVIGAVSIQSAGAVEASKLRQLVVEPAGAPASAGTKTEAPFVAQPAQGIPTPTQTAEIGADAGKPTGTKVVPLVADPSQGIPSATDTADAGAAAAADPQPIDQGQAASETDKAAALASDQPAAGAAPAAGPGRIATGIQSQKGLYLLLTGRGYAVEIVKRDASGNVLFSVTVPGHPGEAYLLLVDEYGKVIERRHVATADGYGKAHANAPAREQSYAPTYAAADDDCDTSAGY